MKNTLIIIYLALNIVTFSACSKDDSPVEKKLYFPPTTGNEWQTVSASSLGWNTTELSNLDTYLQSKNTKSFIILKEGKIVAEKYFGTFTADSIWYWASAGKTLTAFLVGIAQKEGIININNKTSDYIGTGWTSELLAKENLITVRHQLTMTTGLDDGITDNDCTLPAHLVYKADAGTRWAYHNANSATLDMVVEETAWNYSAFFIEKVYIKTGVVVQMYRIINNNNIFFSRARDMARFGLLLLNKGIWDNTIILNDPDYFNNMINTSQTLNLSYGYSTWLNGKSSYMLPNDQTVYSGSIIPNAPSDLYAALGDNDQKIYVIPSQNLVVIRMGKSAGEVQAALSGFDNELWGKLKTIIGY